MLCKYFAYVSLSLFTFHLSTCPFSLLIALSSVWIGRETSLGYFMSLIHLLHHPTHILQTTAPSKKNCWPSSPFWARATTNFKDKVFLPQGKGAKAFFFYLSSPQKMSEYLHLPHKTNRAEEWKDWWQKPPNVVLFFSFCKPRPGCWRDNLRAGEHGISEAEETKKCGRQRAFFRYLWSPGAHVFTFIQRKFRIFSVLFLECFVLNHSIRQQIFHFETNIVSQHSTQRRKFREQFSNPFDSK